MTRPLSNFDTTSDRLLTEVERQQEYLARLPEYCALQLFSMSGALESRRRSGYRNTAAVDAVLRGRN